MTSADPSAYDWLFDGELEWVGDAACFTVAPGATREELAEAFGVDLEAGPVSPEQLDTETGGDTGGDMGGDTGEAPHLVGFTEIDGHQVAVEPNGFGGSQPELLGPLSSGRTAASAFWNVNALVRFVCAADGVVLYDGEFVYDGTDGLPADLVPLVELVADDLETDLLVEPSQDAPIDIAVAMAMLETYTGVRITPEDVTRALRQQFVREV